ncbi:MAG: hypothetical protein J7465_03295 [Chloroflexus sp.]|nr:hypothetical protein [Chloroflexus sp.]
MDGLGLLSSLFVIWVIVAGILASWLFDKYSKSGSKNPLAPHPDPQNNHPSPAPPVSPAAVYQFQWPFGNMSFDDFLQQSASFSALQDTLKDNLNRRLWSMGIGDGMTILIQAVNIDVASRTYTVTFSPEGQRLLQLGQLSIMGNGRIPMLVDATGKIVEIGQISKNLGLVATSLVTLVVSVAHFISTADLVKRIKNIDKKIDWLVAMRRIDQLAKYERIFVAARERCMRPIGEREQMELRRMRDELRELRTVLRREWEMAINQLEVKPSWVNELRSNWWVREWEGEVNNGVQPWWVIELRSNPFYKNLPIKEHIERLIQQPVNWAIQSEQQRLKQELHKMLPYPVLIELGWRLELVLAMASKTEVEFATSLIDELKQVEKVLHLIENKGKPIHLEYSLLEPYRSLLANYNDLAHSYRSLPVS